MAKVKPSAKPSEMLRSMDVASYVEYNLKYLDANAHIELCRSLAATIRLCRDKKKLGLAMLIIMSITIDLSGEIEAAIEAWAPISARVGNPVSVSDVPAGKPGG